MAKGQLTRMLATAAAAVLAVALLMSTSSHRHPGGPAFPSITVAGPPAGSPRPVHKASPWPRPAWVAVPVANVWDHSDSARPIDAAMAGPTPNVVAWLARLDYEGRLALDNLLATQVLLNDPLVVLGQSGPWAYVRVTGQRGAVWRQGIEGWMPAPQLTFDPPPKTDATATVTSPSVIIGNLRLSYGTVLPVLAATKGALTVALPGADATVPTSEARTDPLTGSGSAVVAQAERFLGLPYLWAGSSGFGFDCSGLTFAVYRQFGITLPRDAADQAAAGTPVTKKELKPGDLVFFAFSGPIDHVGIYAGGGKMLDSPQTGGAVELVDMWGTPLSTHFVRAARFLPLGAAA
jgi:gamma-D-glutamyl-L-lysine dipeptidyl-peptidase